MKKEFINILLLCLFKASIFAQDVNIISRNNETLLPLSEYNLPIEKIDSTRKKITLRQPYNEYVEYKRFREGTNVKEILKVVAYNTEEMQVVYCTEEDYPSGLISYTFESKKERKKYTSFLELDSEIPSGQWVQVLYLSNQSDEVLFALRYENKTLTTSIISYDAKNLINYSENNTDYPPTSFLKWRSFLLFK